MLVANNFVVVLDANVLYPFRKRDVLLHFPQIGVRMSPEMREALLKVAARERRGLGWVVKEFCAEGLRRDAQAAKKRKVT